MGTFRRSVVVAKRHIKTPDGWKVTLEPPFLRAKHRKYGDVVVNMGELEGLSAALGLLSNKVHGMQFGFDPAVPDSRKV